MKIIFLDIDGVLNSSQYRSQLGMGYFSEIIDRRKMPLLKHIVEETGAEVVLSSTWRKFWNPGEKQSDPAGQYISDLFREHGLWIYSKTPVLENAGRSEEIQAWLDQHPYIDGYVILDDKDFGWPPSLRVRFVQTDLCGDGLEESQVRQAIDVLKGNLLPVPASEGKIKSGIKNWMRSLLKSMAR
jgi:hypothetical protein